MFSEIQPSRASQVELRRLPDLPEIVIKNQLVALPLLSHLGARVIIARLRSNQTITRRKRIYISPIAP